MYGDDANYCGRDWDECPYEIKGGRVYDEYIKDIVDVAYIPDVSVLEPCSDIYLCGTSPYSKNDLKDRTCPCFVIDISGKQFCYKDALLSGSTLCVYFGDKLEDITSNPYIFILAPIDEISEE